MVRKRATGRFYFLLILILAIIAYFLYQSMPRRAMEGVVSVAMSTDTRVVEAVIVRDELVTSYEGLERVEYIAAEGQNVSVGDAIADIYTISYIEKELTRLASTRDSIRAYHRSLLAENEDSDLNVLCDTIALRAREMRALVSGATSGNLILLERQLSAAMNARREYMSIHMLDNTKLMQLYADEEKRVNSIVSWKNSATADRSGIVSFYFDGYETALTAENFTSLTADTLRKAYVGDTSIQTQRTKRSEQVYRIVSDSEWYVALLSRDASWSPVTGQQLSFRFEGFEDLVYTGVVMAVQRSGNDVVIQLSVTDPIGPLVNQRAGKVEVGIYTTGLAVPVGAIYYQNSQPGVWVGGAYGISFIPVQILSQNSDYAIVQPMQSGALYEGQTVMIY